MNMCFQIFVTLYEDSTHILSIYLTSNVLGTKLYLVDQCCVQ